MYLKKKKRETKVGCCVKKKKLLQRIDPFKFQFLSR